MKKSAFIFSDGELKGRTVQYFSRAKIQKIIFRLRISAIFIFSVRLPLQRSSGAGNSEGILLHFYNYNEYYVGTYYPREHYNSGL